MAPRKQKKPDHQLSFLQFMQWRAPEHVRMTALEMARRPEHRKDTEIASTSSQHIDQVRAALRVLQHHLDIVERDPEGLYFIVKGHWLLRIWENRGPDAYKEQQRIHDGLAAVGWDPAKVLSLLQGLSALYTEAPPEAAGESEGAPTPPAPFLEREDAVQAILACLVEGDERLRAQAIAEKERARADIEKRAQQRVKVNERRESATRVRRRESYQGTQNTEHEEVLKKVERIRQGKPPTPEEKEPDGTVPVEQRADLDPDFDLNQEGDDQ